MKAAARDEIERLERWHRDWPSGVDLAEAQLVRDGATLPPDTDLTFYDSRDEKDDRQRRGYQWSAYDEDAGRSVVKTGRYLCYASGTRPSGYPWMASGIGETRAAALEEAYADFAHGIAWTWDVTGDA